MGELSYQRAPALLISFIIFIAVALSYVPIYLLPEFDFLTQFVQRIYASLSKKENNTDECKIIGYKTLHFCIFLFGFFIAGFALICIMLGGNMDSTVMSYLSTYYFTIVLFTYVLLQFFPYFINIFENTFGYLFLQFFRKDNTISWLNPFKFDLVLSDKIAPESYKSTNKEFLITVMDILKEYTWLPDVGITDGIKKSLYAKHFVGHFVWVYFACLICTFTIIKTMAYRV